MDTKTQQTIADAFTGMSQAEQDKMMAVLNSLRGGGDDEESNEEYYTNVTKAMQAAGWNPAARAKAGLKAWWNNKVQSSRGSGIRSRTSTKVARFIGLTKTADFIDRWMTGPAKPKKGKKGKKAPAEKAPSQATTATSTTESGSLVGFKKQLDLITGIVQMTAEDVTDIKSLLMPKGVAAKNKAGDTQFAEFNPLMPQGEQFHQVSQKGKLLAIPPRKDFQQSAQKLAAQQTAELVLKIVEKDRAKAELRKKYAFKDEAEKYEEESPLTAINERLDSIEKKLGEKKEGGIFGMLALMVGGLIDKLKDWLSPFLDPIKSIAGEVMKIGRWALKFGRLIGKGLFGLVRTIWNSVKLMRWLMNPAGMAAMMAAAVVAGGAYLLDKAMRKGAEEDIENLMKDTTAKLQRDQKQWSTPYTEEQKYEVYYKKNLETADKAAEARGPQHRMFMKQHLLTSDKLSAEEKAMARRYYQEKDGNVDAYLGQLAEEAEVESGEYEEYGAGTEEVTTPEVPPVPEVPKAPSSGGGPRRGGRRRQTIPAEVVAEGSDTVDTNYADVPVAIVTTAPRMDTVGETGTVTKAEGIPYDRIKTKLGLSKGEWDIYRGTVASIESAGAGGYAAVGGAGDHYDGKYQMGEMAKKDAFRLMGKPYPGHGKKNSAARVAFRNDPMLQEQAFAAYTMANHGYLTSGSPKYKDLAKRKQLEVLGYSHNQGWSGGKNWLEKGIVGSDAFGTKGTKYSEALAKSFKSEPEERVASVTPSPTPTIPGAKIDSLTREKEAATSAAATVAMVAPTTVVNNTNVSQTVGKRPAAKASVLTQDNSLVRGLTKDAQHPVHG